MADENGDFDFLVKQNKLLAESLGHAIWAFALVERATYRYMKKLSTDTLDVLMADQPIPVRIRVVKQLIARADGPEPMKQLAYKCVKKIHDLAEIRNHIAHNPFQTWIDLDERTFISEIEKITDPTKIVSISDLEQFAANATALSGEMEDALAELSYSR